MKKSEGAGPDYLFDIGNVILFFDYGLFARAIEDECRCSAEEILEAVREDREQLERTSMPVDEFLELAFEQVGYTGSREKFVQSWQRIFTPNQPIIEFIDQLSRDGHRLCLLSNTNQLHVDYFLAEYPVFAQFQGHVFSHEAGCAKPDPEIYRLAIRDLELVPEQTVYLDDLEANVAAGGAVGFHSVKYEGQAVSEFDPAAVRPKLPA